MADSAKITENFAHLKGELDKIVLTDAERTKQNKNLVKHAKIASDILGRKTAAQLRMVNRELDLTLLNLEAMHLNLKMD